MKQYIGITDFASFGEVEAMLKVFNNSKPFSCERLLHIGVMMSYKTLNNIPNKWENVFPKKENLASIFASTEAYNCLHYADYNNEPNLEENLKKAISYGGPNLNALQLDMPWPDPYEIFKALEDLPNQLEIILQIGQNALDAVGNNPLEMAQKLSEYKGVIHRVLLDKSMGRGLGMDAKSLIPFAKAVQFNFPEIGIVVAGGLGPQTMHLVQSFIKEFPDASIDAQGRLRPSGNAMDPIDWELASEYLIRANQMLTNA